MNYAACQRADVMTAFVETLNGLPLTFEERRTALRNLKSGVCGNFCLTVCHLYIAHLDGGNDGNGSAD